MIKDMVMEKCSGLMATSIEVTGKKEFKMDLES